MKVSTVQGNHETKKTKEKERKEEKKSLAFMKLKFYWKKQVINNKMGYKMSENGKTKMFLKAPNF